MPPKCDPQTRVAVQDDLYSWIEHGDALDPSNMKWVTGPAGSGKTAIMGSVTERCKTNGFPVVSFFFSSTGSIGRRTKTAFVTTIAHQVAQHRQDLKDAIATAIETDTLVFKKNLHVQMETLVLAPLREVAGASNSTLRGVIIIDGLDECGVEETHDHTTAGLRPKPTRTKEQDQLEILQVLQQASSDPTFPFRIIVASRPERVFRRFFDPEGQPAPIAQKLDLHSDYNAEADITLFLEAHFDRLRRLHQLPPSWVPPNAIKILVDKASGQFIYAATVIRFLEMGHREPPKALLEAILKMEATATVNPLEHLDSLYSHILNSSPDPLLSVRWILNLPVLNGLDRSYASNVNLLLQTDPESNEAEHLLGNLHSLIRIPPPSDQATTKYNFFHKSLFDFLSDPDRSGEPHIQEGQVYGFLWNRFHRMCARGQDTNFSYPEHFLHFLAILPDVGTMGLGIAHSTVLPTSAGADWWLSLDEYPIMWWWLFKEAHYSAAIAALTRLYSTAHGPIKLHHTVQTPPGSDGKKSAVVILHGFFGSKRNWGALTKALMQKLNRPIYALDLRNHGTSPHAEPMTYTAMAEDVWHFVQQHHLSDVSVVGHSMGGKVAMTMALAAGHEKPNDILSKLVVVDISPVKARLSKEFSLYIDTLKEIEDLGLKTRKEATEYLARVEKDPGVQGFLLTNLLPFHRDDPRAKFTVPLDIFKRSVPNIVDFPFVPGERSWEGKTLFVKGTKSPYIREKNMPSIRQFFPNVQFEELNTGHWVHAEKPHEFLDTVSNFIADN